MAARLKDKYYSEICGNTASYLTWVGRPGVAIPLFERAIEDGKAARATHDRHAMAVWQHTKNPAKVIPLLQRLSPAYEGSKDFFRNWKEFEDFPQLDTDWRVMLD